MPLRWRCVIDISLASSASTKSGAATYVATLSGDFHLPLLIMYLTLLPARPVLGRHLHGNCAGVETGAIYTETVQGLKPMTGVTRQSDRDSRRDRAKNNGRGRPGGRVTIISYTPLGRDKLCPGGNPAGIHLSRRESRRN